MKAICIKCGSAKRLPWHKCRKCGLLPAGDDLIKSVYCSFGRFSGDELRSENYEEELERFQAAIRKGEAVNFDEMELERLKKDQSMLHEISPSAVWWTVLRFFFPAFLVLGGIYLVLFILKR